MDMDDIDPVSSESLSTSPPLEIPPSESLDDSTKKRKKHNYKNSTKHSKRPRHRKPKSLSTEEKSDKAPQSSRVPAETSDQDTENGTWPNSAEIDELKKSLQRTWSSYQLHTGLQPSLLRLLASSPVCNPHSYYMLLLHQTAIFCPTVTCITHICACFAIFVM